MTSSETNDWLLKMADEWDKIRNTTPLRKGQFYMNGLWDLDPQTYKMVSGTVADPYFHDSRMQEFIRALWDAAVK